ncbi:hypothetical protein DMZ48_00965 [Robertkochia solimangrovi]|nr:hypothetical protein DMZ48_00965 [Robertkochia solimangrovi]
MCVFLFSSGIFAQQEPTVKTTVDTTKIRIGEQIKFRVEVDADSTEQVFFPEGQTFLPLEVVEDLPIDTIRNRDRFNLIKEYALTQFDSGSYTLPTQQIMVGNRPLFTDSLRIDVNTVVVDTLKQRMYDIKGFQEVQRDNSWLIRLALWILAILLGLSFITYWFFFRKPKLTEEEKVALLPAYDRAKLQLKHLDESKYLIQSEYKEYYTELTNIVRAYIEEDVHVTALESTTDELIAKLEMLKDSGNLKLENDTLKQFQMVLRTADLVKFAKSKPDNTIIGRDRKTVEDILEKTHEALPEPTEEELLHDEQYLELLEKKKRKKQLVYGVVAAAVFLLVATGGLITYYGFHNVKDTITGHPTKAMLETNWVGSDYGYPSIYIETPGVLKRVDRELPEDIVGEIFGNQIFAMGTLEDQFYINLSVTTFKKDSKIEPEKAIDNAIKILEEAGASNLIVKEEKYTSPTGKEGLKVYGTLNVPVKGSDKVRRSEYTLLNFVHNGGIQQLIMVYDSEDRYAEEVMNRIVNSIDFKTEG